MVLINNCIRISNILGYQLSSFFENHFHPFLSAFRSGHGCQTALLKSIEDWKKALDDNI
jgi:hypothetical protein